MFRSSAGNSAVLAEYLNSALKSASPNDDDDEELDVDDLTTASRDSRSYAHNAHWLPAGSGGPSRYVGYYDAASLYPSSGKLQNLPEGSLPKASIEANPIFSRARRLGFGVA